MVLDGNHHESISISFFMSSFDSFTNRSFRYTSSTKYQVELPYFKSLSIIKTRISTNFHPVFFGQNSDVS